jgi:transposase
MIVIGVDVHKAEHALAAVDDGTGKVRGQRQITADEDGHLDAVRWAQGLDAVRVWAIEDCRHVSQRLEQALLAAGERVVRVAPHRMGASRRGERRAGKSDQIDALAIARAVVSDGVDAFPVAALDPRALEIRLLSDQRQQLVGERTRQINRLRWHLVALCPDLEASCGRDAFTRLRGIDRAEQHLRTLATEQLLRRTIAQDLLAQIRQLTIQEKQLERHLTQLTTQYAPQLLARNGCGPHTAAILIGRTAGMHRFRSDACFSRHTGTSPIPASSGQNTTHRLDRGGDRQLNRAIHTIAITRARTDAATQAYLARKHAEGKTRKGAIRCLKRHIAREIYHLLLPRPTLPATPGTRCH